MTSGSIMDPEPHDAISERAAEFWERRRFGGWGNTDQAELDAWLAESTLHRVAYLRVEGIAAHTDKLAAVHTFKVEVTPAPAASNGAEKSGARRFVVPLLLAASVALLAVLGFPYVRAITQSPDRTYSTEIGGRTLLNFADHTQIELNTDTVARFRMTTTERTVWLEKGEAWFNVAHNRANPFTVIVGRHRVTDLGTEFLIRRDPAEMEVALVKGHATLGAEGAPTTVLAPGDEAVATQVAVSVTKKTPQQLADELAWRRGMLVFRNTPLSEVVREFNRYNTTKLVIADPSIADERINGDAKTDDYESFLQLAEASLNLRVARRGSVILISGGQTEKTRRAVRTAHSR